MSFFERTFKLEENGTSVKTEMLAGITSFMTIAYILVVNPIILEEAGMDFGGVFTATALSAVIATLVMAFHANYPFVLAPGMGLNAFFAYTVVIGMGYSWEFALTAVFIEGIIFIIMSFFNIREAIVKAIPTSLKHAVSVGIGLFIAFLGLVNGGVVQEGGAILELGNMKSGPVMVALIGLIITGVLLAKNVKGALLIGILASTVIALPLGVTSLPEGLKLFSLPPSLSSVAFKLDFSNIFTIDMVIIVFTFLFVDMFDTIGTLIGVACKADMLDEDGSLPNVKQALMADAIGTTAGALLGTSTVTTYVESASGVAEGGRTGLTALSAAGMFAISLFLAPLFTMIPSAATAPALILVGLFMLEPIFNIDLKDYTEAIPAFLTIIMMPLAYSIADGIAFGMISYVLIKIFTGKFKDVTPVMYILAALFLIKLFAM